MLDRAHQFHFRFKTTDGCAGFLGLPRDLAVFPSCDHRSCTTRAAFAKRVSIASAMASLEARNRIV